MAELKKCPFCGNEGRIRKYRTYDCAHHGTAVRFYVECIGCHVEVPALGYESENEAIKAWNRRWEHGKHILAGVQNQ